MTKEPHRSSSRFDAPPIANGRFSRDPSNRNRLASRTDAELRTESYLYDSEGHLLFHTDREGQVTGYDYDALGRRIRVGFGATSTTAPVYTSTIAYGYDAADRLTTVQDSEAGTIIRSYDDRFDTVSQETTPDGTVTYTYEARGLRDSLIPSGGTPLTYAYDAAGRLRTITQAAGSGPAQPATAQTVGFDYDDADRLSRVTLPNGITADYRYDAASQLTGLVYTQADGTPIGNLSYTYDADGTRTALGGSLARSGLPTAIADARYDANHRLTQKDGVAYTYDANGNLTSDGISTYTWNARHQLTGISGPDTLDFQYDGLGRRRSLTVNGRTTVTLYDGWNPIQLQEHGIAVENRLMGLGLDALYARVRDGQVESYLTDALGSVLELRDAAQARTVSYTYDPYGGTQASGTSSNTVKYTGREQDLGDLYYYRHRYYKPSIGRFLSEDPIGLAGGENWYAYVNNNPVIAVDPTGQFEIFVRPWWLSPLRWLEPFKLPGPPVGQPKPPGWTPDWEWKCSEARPDAGPRWFDPKGGEWRWGEDKRHVPHWDYNPWDRWNSPWKNLDLDGNELAPGQQLRPPQNSIPSTVFTPDCYASGLCS